MNHLSTLIQRLRNAESLDEGIPKDRLVNLAEYITYYRPCVDYSLAEMREATEILQGYRLEKLIGSKEGIEQELQNPRRTVHRCRRCGRLIWSKKSILCGLGSVCRHKASKSLDTQTRLSVGT